MNVGELKALLQNIPDDRTVIFYDESGEKYYEPSEIKQIGAYTVTLGLKSLREAKLSLNPEIDFVPNPYCGGNTPKQLDPDKDKLDISNPCDRVSYYWQQVCNHHGMWKLREEILQYRWGNGLLEVIVPVKFDRYNQRKYVEDKILQAQSESMGMSGGRVLVICEV